MPYSSNGLTVAVAAVPTVLEVIGPVLQVETRAEAQRQLAICNAHLVAGRTETANAVLSALIDELFEWGARNLPQRTQIAFNQDLVAIVTSMRRTA